MITEKLTVIAKVFKWGNYQVIRLPRKFYINADEVEIFQQGDNIVMREIPKNLGDAFYALTLFPKDFFSEERKDTLAQERAV